MWRVNRYVDEVRQLLNQRPLVKRVAKVIFTPVIVTIDRQYTKKYNNWLRKHLPTAAELQRQRVDAEAFGYLPLITIVVPTFNPDSGHFIEMAQSVIAQSYQNWELIFIDDASSRRDVRDTIRRLAEADKRITYHFLKTNRQIAGATNEGIKRATGEFVGLLDNDDILQPNALYEVVKVLNQNTALNFIYSDEDKFETSDTPHSYPYFKPDWNPEFLRSVNYITHFAVMRRSVLDSIGGEDGEYNGAQDWELFLRIARNIDDSTIAHIPKILYSWRVHDGSTAKGIEVKPYVVQAQRRLLEADMQTRHIHGYQLKQDNLYPAQWVVSYPAVPTTEDLLIIAMNDQAYSSAKPLEALGKYVVRHQDAVDARLDLPKVSYVLYVFEPVNETDFIKGVEGMLSDAIRKDIGFVVAAHRDPDMAMRYIERMINPDAVDLVKRSSTREVTKHFYTTVRYNIPQVLPMGIMMIQSAKLLTALSRCNCELEDVQSISMYLEESESCRSLYNPYVRC